MFIAAAIFFALNGITFGSWAARVPDVSRELDLTTGTLGAALFCISLGALASMQVTGSLCARFGAKRVGLITVAAFTVSLPLPALTGNLTELCLALLVFGTASGAANVAANSLGVEVEARAKRPVMSSLHAVFSLGGLAGSATGGLLAGFLPAVLHLSLITLASLLICGWLATVLPKVVEPPLERSAHSRQGRHAKSRGRRTLLPEPAGPPSIAVNLKPVQPLPPSAGRFSSHAGVLIALGAIAACTSFAEGALGDWGALHLRENLHAAPGLAAAGYALFSLAMATGRLAGHRLIARCGDARVLIGGTVLAATGTLTTAFGGSLAMALSGFLLVGLGLANVYPLAIGRAGLLNGAKGVGLASTVGYVGPLAGPPLIGAVAGAAGLRTALSGVSILVLVATALSIAVAAETPSALSVAAALRRRYARTRQAMALARGRVSAVRLAEVGRTGQDLRARLSDTA
ncbi:MFS transporter [Kineosporia sp. J2-2]|uniref:MFS transporter n=1 Tax=Kineosporia corallincola TaxID=2835133 RepID=A0ABS5TF37_9ACTN|nr:MFS transporter [Kineosporia corallincola]MBT0769660.1 MFS transporter [Kineosporia corallincola]